jgi:hypothetical protein
VSGTISGYVAPAEAGAAVFAEQNGHIIKGTVADSNGQFVLTPLEQSSTSGNYDVVIVQNNVATGVVRSVPVVVNTSTVVATSSAPIALPASVMHVASGTVLPISAQAIVRALQPISGLNYEITSANANLDTGAYALNLPTAAPLVGTYSGSLPVSLVPVASAAGQYTAEADSVSGATQASTVNVSATDQANVNFSF